MSNNSFKERIKYVEPERSNIQKDKKEFDIEDAYKYHLNLKNDKVFENRVDNAVLQLIDLFSDRYKGVKIDTPIGREKSEKSIKGKISKLEIERLCTKYAIDDLSDKEKEELLSLLNEKIEKDTLIQKKIKKIMYGEIEDLKLLENLMKEKNVNDIVKMAISRITRIRIEKEETDSKTKEAFIEKIEYNYGEEAAKRTGKLANNIMHWENIEKVKEINDKEEIEKIYNPEEYLKIKDLRAFRLVVASVPDDIETDNNDLKYLIDRRTKFPETDISNFNDLCCIEVEKDFATYLENNAEILKKMNLQLLSRKEKQKQNGYLADHIKLCCLDENGCPIDDYTFELQIRSIHRDDMARGNGPAGHSKRPGKKRILPNIKNKETFKKDLEERIPKYTIFPLKDGKRTIRKCNSLESMTEYFIEYIDIDSKEYKKMTECLTEENEGR